MVSLGSAVTSGFSCGFFLRLRASPQRFFSLAPAMPLPSWMRYDRARLCVGDAIGAVLEAVAACLSFVRVRVGFWLQAPIVVRFLGVAAPESGFPTVGVSAMIGEVPAARACPISRFYARRAVTVGSPGASQLRATGVCALRRGGGARGESEVAGASR